MPLRMEMQLRIVSTADEIDHLIPDQLVWIVPELPLQLGSELLKCQRFLHLNEQGEWRAVFLTDAGHALSRLRHVLTHIACGVPEDLVIR